MDTLQQLFDTRLFSLGGTPVTVATLAVAVLIVVASLILSFLIQKAVTRALRRRGLAEEGTVGAMLRLLHYVVMLVGVGVALDTIGFSLGALFAAGAVFAVGLGFAMQNIAQNFVSGVILLIERSIRPGDILGLEGRMVRVQQLGIRSTLVRTRDDEDMIVPNSVIVQSTVKNFTLRDSLYRIRVQVGVVYRSDMATVRRTLERVGNDVSWRAKQRAPVVLMREFADSSVNFEVSVWIDDPWDAMRARSDLHEAIWTAVIGAGITIAFPQLDVHFDPPVEESMRSLAAASA